MDRNELKNLSGRVTRQYACMLQEMSLHQTDGPVVPRRGPDELLYLRITELSRRWVTEAQPVWKLMEELFIGLYAMAAPVSLVFSSDGNAVSVYIGASQRHIESLPAMLRGVFPRIRWSETDSGIQLFSYAQAAGRQLPCGGFLKGDPTGSENFLAPFQIDAVIQAMAGRPWTLALFAQPVKKASTLTRQQHWLHYATLCSTLTQITYSSTDNAENTTYRQSYYEGEQYVKKVDGFCQRALEALSLGEWCLSFNFSAASEQDVRLLGGLLTAAFYGEESEPEPVHAIFRTGPGKRTSGGRRGIPAYRLHGAGYPLPPLCLLCQQPGPGGLRSLSHSGHQRHRRYRRRVLRRAPAIRRRSGDRPYPGRRARHS